MADHDWLDWCFAQYFSDWFWVMASSPGPTLLDCKFWIFSKTKCCGWCFSAQICKKWTNLQTLQVSVILGNWFKTDHILRSLHQVAFSSVKSNLDLHLDLLTFLHQSFIPHYNSSNINSIQIASVFIFVRSK